MELLLYAKHLSAALVLGAVIGAERQWRQRKAGLRTNTLVAVGSCLFSMISLALPAPGGDPTRIAAQIVSGIGFLGAGTILREGLSVKGLNTAATLWCAAAVGTMTGFGLIPHAVMGTVAVVIANVLLRPVAKSINRQPVAEPDEGYGYDVEAICRAHDESQVRFLLLQAVNNSPLTLQALHSADIDGSPMVRVSAQLEGAEKQHALLEQIVARLSMEAGVSAVSWKVRENETTA